MDLHLCACEYLLCTHTCVGVCMRVCFCSCMWACSSDRVSLHSYAPYTHTDVQRFVYLRMENTHVSSHVCTYVCTPVAKYAHSWKLAFRLCLVCMYVHTYMFVFVCTIWITLANSSSGTSTSVAVALLKIPPGTQHWYPETIETSSARCRCYQSITWRLLMFSLSLALILIKFVFIFIMMKWWSHYNVNCMQSLDPSPCTLAFSKLIWKFWVKSDFELLERQVILGNRLTAWRAKYILLNCQIIVSFTCVSYVFVMQSNYIPLHLLTGTLWRQMSTVYTNSRHMCICDIHRHAYACMYISAYIWIKLKYRTITFDYVFCDKHA